MKFLRAAGILLLLFLIVRFSYGQPVTGDYRSFATGNWNNVNTWQRFNGTSWINPAPTSPTSTDGVITIRNGHTVTDGTGVTADQIVVNSGGTLVINGVTFTVAAGSGDDLTINAGGIVTVNSGSTLQILNSPPPPFPPPIAQVRVYGTLNNAGAITGGGTSNLFFESGSVYDHQHTTAPGTIPTATWNSNSTCKITGYTTNNSAPSGLSQTFGNFTWDTGSLSSYINLAGALTTVQGNLIFQNIPSNYLSLTLSTNYTLNVSGDLTISNSYISLNSSASATINVTGNTLFSNNSDLNFTGSGNLTFDVNGNFEIAGGTVNLTYGGTGGIPLNVAGSFTLSSSPTLNNGGSGTYSLTFDGSGTQTYTASQSFTGFDYIIKNGSTVNVPNGNFFSGIGAFTLQAGATLGVQDVNGLVQGTSSGNMRVSGTRTYTANGNVVYNGSSAQNLGDEWDIGGGLDGVAVNLEIDNASGVTNNIIGTTSVVGILTLTNGPLNIGNTNTFDIQANFVGNGGTIAGHATGSSSISFSGTGTITGTLDLASPFDFKNLTINRAATVTLGTNLNINGTLSFASTGNLDLNGQTLTISGVNGDITQTGSGGLSSTSTATNLVLNGTEALTAIPFCTTCGSMQLNDVTFGRTGTSPSYTWNSAVTINGNVNLNSGTLTHSTGLNMATGANFNRGASGSISAAPTATTTYNVSYNGNMTTGPELPTVASGDLANLTVAGNVILNKAIDINGNLTINSGLLDANTNDVTLSGSTFTINAGSFTINGANTFTFDNAGTTSMGGAAIAGTQFGNLTINSATTLTAPAANINVSATWNNLGTFTAGSGKVTFNGASQNVDPNSQAFNDVEFGGTGTKTLQGALVATGTLTISSTLDVGANQSINVAGSWVNSGTFTAQSGTVTFDGTAQSINSSGQPFFNLTLSNSGTKTLAAALDVNGALTIDNGVTLDDGVSTYAINLAGNWTNNGTFNQLTGTVTFDGTSTIAGSTTTTFHNVTIAGTLTASSGTTNVDGDWLYSSGTFNNGSGTIAFNGGTQSITSGGQAFNNISISGTNTKTLQDAMDINGNLTLSASTFSVGTNQQINIAGDWLATSGLFTPASGTVIFDGAAQNITSAGQSFNTVQIAGSAAKTLQDAFDANGDVTITTTLTAGTNNLNVGGNWDATGGTFTSTGTTTFDGAAQSITSNANSFGGVTIAGSSTKTLQDALDVNGTLTISSTLDVGTNQSVNVSGDWASTGTFTAASGTVTLDGAAQNITSNASAFNALTLAGTGTKTLQDALDVNGTLTISSTLDVGSDNAITAAGDWTNNGTFTGNTGTVTFDGIGTQTISGTGTNSFSSMTISNASTSGVLNDGTSDLFGTLSLTGGGKFDADGAGSGAFTIKSTAINSDGRIAALATPANLTGNLNVERFVNGPGDWRYVAVPVIGANLGMFKNTFPVTGNYSDPSPAGVDNVIVSSAASVYRYDATVPNWVGIGAGGTVASTTLTNGVGYSAYTYLTGNGTATFTGTAGKGNINTTISSGQFNLMGNPYPSAIDWDNITLTGLSSTLSVRTGNGTFATYVQGGPATNPPFVGWAGEIASGQSFWINSTSATTFSLTESTKTAGTNQFVRTSPIEDYIRITLMQGSERDETIIMFRDDATEGLDPQYDAIKRDNAIFDLAIVASDSSQDFTISTVPLVECERSYRLNVTDAAPGSYQLGFTDLENFLLDYTITLYDHFTNTNFSVQNQSYYSFEVTSDSTSFGSQRFEIVFTKPQIDINRNFNQYVVDACAKQTVEIALDSTQVGVNYQLYIDTKPVSSDLEGTGSSLIIPVSSDSLSSGLNWFVLKASVPNCNSEQIDQFISFDNQPFEKITSIQDGHSCGIGTVQLEVSGVSSSGYYNWYETIDGVDPIQNVHGSSLITPELQSDKSYYVAAVNSLDCENPERIKVTAYVTSLETPIVRLDGTTLSTTVAEGTLQWFKDGVPLTGETGDSLFVEESGSYSVEVSVNGCSTSSEKQTVEITGIESDLGIYGLRIYPNPVENILYISPDKKAGVKIKSVFMFDLNGKLLTGGGIDNMSRYNAESGEFSVQDIKPGIYILNISIGDRIVTYRIRKK